MSKNEHVRTNNARKQDLHPGRGPRPIAARHGTEMRQHEAMAARLPARATGKAGDQTTLATAPWRLAATPPAVTTPTKAALAETNLAWTARAGTSHAEMTAAAWSLAATSPLAMNRAAMHAMAARLPRAHWPRPPRHRAKKMAACACPS